MAGYIQRSPFENQGNGLREFEQVAVPWLNFEKVDVEFDSLTQERRCCV
jgi:hypothetical protein